jgi:hypothetical protein
VLLGAQLGRARPLRPKDEGELTARVAAGQSYGSSREIDPQYNIVSEAVDDIWLFFMRGDCHSGELGRSGQERVQGLLTIGLRLVSHHMVPFVSRINQWGI